MNSKLEIFEYIFEKILQNRDKSPQESYSASLFKDAKGKNKILEKLGEEAIELVIAAKDGNKTEIIHETADLWFHSLALLAIYDVNLKEVFDELKVRQKKYK